jgi:hypothetical protein
MWAASSLSLQRLARLLAANRLSHSCSVPIAFPYPDIQETHRAVSLRTARTYPLGSLLVSGLLAQADLLQTFGIYAVPAGTEG